MISIKVNHNFVGGNNPRLETEELEVEKDSVYKIKNRSNQAYKIIDDDIPKLEGEAITDAIIDITYGGKQSVEVIYLEKGSNLPLAFPTKEEGFRGHSITPYARNFDGYKVPQTITYDIPLEDKENIVTYIYEAINSDFVLTIDPSNSTQPTGTAFKYMLNTDDTFTSVEMTSYPEGVLQLVKSSISEFHASGLQEGTAIVRAIANKDGKMYPALAKVELV